MAISVGFEEALRLGSQDLPRESSGYYRRTTVSTNEAYMNLAAGRGTDGQGRDALGGRVTRQELELSLRMVFDTVVQMMRETVEERVGEVSDRIELVIQKQDQGFESLRYLMTATGKLNKEHINMAVDQKGLWAKIESVESELYDSIRNVEGNISNCRECVDRWIAVVWREKGNFIGNWSEGSVEFVWKPRRWSVRDSYIYIKAHSRGHFR